MKTKEIDVWVHPDQVDKNLWWNNNNKECISHFKIGSGWLKAKLIIEIPEKKITITESEFDNIVRGLDTGIDVINTHLFKKTKEKLFKEKE